MENDQEQANFRLKEYELLKEEIATAVAETRTIERNTLICTAAIWTWLLALKPEHRGGVWWIPVAIVIFSAIRSATLYIGIERIGYYIAIAIEGKIFGNSNGAWERYIRPNLRKSSADLPIGSDSVPPFQIAPDFHWKRILSFASIPSETRLVEITLLFWIVLFVTTIVVAISGTVGAFDFPEMIEKPGK